MTPAEYNLDPIKRGDTYPSFEIADITYELSGDAIPIASARLQIRSIRNVLIYEWSTGNNTIVISGIGNNRLTFSELTNIVTAPLTPGNHLFDLEVTTIDGDTWTLIAGTALIEADVSRT